MPFVARDERQTSCFPTRPFAGSIGSGTVVVLGAKRGGRVVLSVESIETVSQLPIPIRFFRWQPRRSTTWMLTVVCKATYLLVPTQAELAPVQEPILDEDRFWDDDEARSVRAVSDLAPFKPRADVTLVGMAYAPPPNPVHSFVARLIVGELDKSIEVFCDRTIRLDGSLEDGPRITRMALHYERSAGGPETDNPVGVRPGARDKHGNSKVPNLQPLALHVTGASDLPPPINFGPIAATWPSRARKLGRIAATKRPEELIGAALPDDLDPSYFNVAPLDQQIDVLRDDERIVLDNLHARHPHFVTSLPGLRPKVVFSGRATGPQPIVMRPDTLAIDTERSLCTLTFRGQLQLAAKDERGRVIAVLEWAREDLSAADVEKKVGIAARPAETADVDMQQTVTLNVNELAAQGELPFAAPGSERTAVFPRPVDLMDTWDPVSGSGATLEINVSSLGDVLPFLTSPSAAPAQEVEAPALVFAPPPPEAPKPASPWTAGTTRVSSPDLGTAAPANASPPGFSVPMTAGKTIGETFVAASPNAPATAEAGKEAVPAEALPSITPNENPLVLAKRAAIVLLWVDRKSMPRITRKPGYRAILDALEEEPIDPEVDDPALSKDPTEIQDKAHAHEILARATPLRLHQLVSSLEHAARRRGQVAAPIERCDGELSVAFDEFEFLRATIAAARMSATGKDALLAVLKEGADFLDMPNHLLAPAIAVVHTNKVRDAFATHVPGLPKDHLDTIVLRGLAEQRKYQKRKIFGGTYLRGLLHFEDQKRPVPVYLPATLEEELPLLPRFPVSALVEVHLPVDPMDEQAIALKAVAIARRVELAR